MADIQEAVGRLLVRFENTVCKKYAAEMEQWAKANAPWQDQTGDARRLLKGEVLNDEDSLGVTIMHRKEYGKHLETANSGKYAILKPTIEQFRGDFFAAFKSCFGGKD